MNARSIVDILIARRWLVLGFIALMVLASPLLAKILRPTYQASAEIAMIGGSASGKAVLPSTDLPDLAMSTDVIERVIGRLHLPDSVDKIRGGLTVKVAPKSDVLPITFKDRVAYRAVTISNAVADLTVVAFKELATRQYDQVLNDLRSQLGAQQAKIRTIDGRLQRAVQRDAFASSSSAGDTLSARLTLLSEQRGQANASYVADLATASEQSRNGGLATVVKEQALASDPYYVALRANEAKDKADNVTMRAGYTDSYPGLPGMQEKVAREGTAVKQAANSAATQHVGASSTYAQLLMAQRNANALVAGDRARLAAIDRQVVETEGHLKDLPFSGVASNSLRLQRDSAASAYQQLSARLQSTLADQAQAAALNSIVVLDHAQRATPKIPAALMATLLAVVIMALAIGIAFAAETIDPRFRNPVEVEDLYGVSRLGSISR